MNQDELYDHLTFKGSIFPYFEVVVKDKKGDKYLLTPHYYYKNKFFVFKMKLNLPYGHGMITRNKTFSYLNFPVEVI